MPGGLQDPELNVIRSPMTLSSLTSHNVPTGSKQPASTEPWNPQRDRGEEKRFEEQDAKTQEYMTSNGFRITIKPILAKVFRYQKYNVFGEPIYSISMQSILNIEKIPSTSA